MYFGGPRPHDLPLSPEAATPQGPLALQGFQQEVRTSWLLPCRADGTAGKKQGLFLRLPRGLGLWGRGRHPAQPPQSCGETAGQRRRGSCPRSTWELG